MSKKQTLAILLVAVLGAAVILVTIFSRKSVIEDTGIQPESADFSEDVIRDVEPLSPGTVDPSPNDTAVSKEKRQSIAGVIQKINDDGVLVMKASAKEGLEAQEYSIDSTHAKIFEWVFPEGGGENLVKMLHTRQDLREGMSIVVIVGSEGDISEQNSLDAAEIAIQ